MTMNPKIVRTHIRSILSIYIAIVNSIIFLDDWRSDQYRWSNQGVHLLPKKKPKVKKSYFQIDTPEGPTDTFIKHACISAS